MRSQTTRALAFAPPAGVVAEELGLKVSDVVTYTGDTDLTPVDLGSYSSRVTLMTGNAAIAAASQE